MAAETPRRGGVDRDGIARAEIAVARAIVDDAPPDRALALAVAGIGEALGLRGTSLWVIADPERIVLREFWITPALRALAAPAVEAAMATVYPPGQGLPGRVWAAGAPIWVDDLAAEATRPLTPRAAAAGTLLSGAVLGFPLHGPRSEVLGVIEFAADTAFPRETWFRDGVSLAGRLIGSYIARVEAEVRLGAARDELAQVAADRRRLLQRVVAVQEEERRTIAGDIHDDSVQVMTAAGIRLQSLRRRVTDEQAATGMERVEEMIGHAVQRLRRLMFDLRPAALDDHGVCAAVNGYLERLQRETGMEFSVRDDEASSRLGGELAVLVYRVIQEALTNVVKHAGASRVDVVMAERDGGVLVRVEDDGVGFDPAVGPAQDHYGLSSMRERAEIAGGWLSVVGRLGAGTTVEFWVPLGPPA